MFHCIETCQCINSLGTGFACWPFFQIDPHLESLREEPEFKRLVGDLEQEYAIAGVQDT